MKCRRREGNHHGNSDSIIGREGAVHRTEKERQILAAKNFNNNLVRFLPPYHVLLVTCMSALLRV